MKLDLCKIFGVELYQTFWIKKRDEDFFEKVYINHNKLFRKNYGTKDELIEYKINDINDIAFYDEKPAEINSCTKKWLSIINKKYQAFLIQKDGQIIFYKYFYEEKPYAETTIVHTFAFYKDLVELYDIDLSILTFNKMYRISDLLQESK